MLNLQTQTRRPATGWVALVVICFWLAGAAGAGEPKRPASPAEPDYRGYVQQCLPRPLAFTHRPGVSYRAEHAQVAAVHVFLWQWTRRKEYALTALELVKAIAGNWSSTDDFFTLHPFLHAYQGLENGGLIDDGLRAQVRELVRRKYRPGQRGNHNQTACRIAGVALALKVFPDLPEAKKWAGYVKAGWNDWYALRDTVENAPNYNRIFWESMFHVADLTDRNSLLNDPRVRKVFERYRDQVSPGGVLPGVGDSPPRLRDTMWIAVFERAAALYRDPTLRWAAFLMQPLPAPDPAGDGNVRAVGELLPLCYADGWRDRTLQPLMPRTRTVLLTRRTPDNGKALDQLVLARARAPGTPFAMLELFAGLGGHAHPEYGAVQFFEVDNVPLLQGPGYNNRAPNHNNLVYVTAASEPFPHREIPFEANVWYQASLSLRPLWPMRRPPVAGTHAAALAEAKQPPATDADLNLRHLDTMSFRVENGGRNPNPNVPPIDLWLKRMRLAGPGGEKVLDDFDAGAPERWRGGLQRELSLEARQGKTSLRVTFGSGATLLSQSLDRTWDARAYTHLRFDWKLSSNRSALARPLILRLGDRGRNLDFHVDIPNLVPVVSSATANMRGDDCHGTVTLTAYFTEDTTLRREVVLTQEGVLIVRDTLRPGKAADSRVAGSLWHLPSRPEAGPNWFDAEVAGDAGKNKRVLVWLAPAKGRSCGVQHVKRWGGFEPYTVYAREVLKAKHAVTFITVLVPHDAAASAAGLAKVIAVETSANRTTVVLELAGGKLRVIMSQDGKWRVAR